MRLKTGLLGIGKIARDQHIPALTANSRFELVACASRNARVEGFANFTDLESMLAGTPGLQCVSICTPPQAHFEAALTALRAGCHVMLEKPPTATTRQIALLAEEAARRQRTLFQSWHSRFAAAVDAAREWLRTRKLLAGKITWKEDVHHWHPGQRWIWEPGGFGVFDPGINALSVLTEVLADEVAVERALLEFPENQQAPIAADLTLRTTAGVAIARRIRFSPEGRAELGHRAHHHQRRAQAVARRRGSRHRRKIVSLDEGLAGEYPRLYERFASLCEAGSSEVDWRPFQLVADAFLVGERRIVAPHEI